MFKNFIYILSLVGIGVSLTSCENHESYNLSKLQEEVKTKLYTLTDKEKEHIKALIKAVFPKGWKLIDVFGVKNSGTNLFKQYLVAVYNPYQHLVYYRFIWLTKKGNYLITNLYKIEGEKVSLILPKKDKEYSLEDLRWLLNIERIVFSENLPQTLLKGNKYIYLIWNPYCESCYKKWKEVIKEATQKDIGIKLIPYHNIYYPIDNLYMLIYLLYRAQNEGLFTILNTYYSLPSYKEFLNKLKTDTFIHLKDIPRKEFNSIGFALKQINKVLKEAKIFVVPTTVEVVNIDPTAGLASGYVYVGQIRLNIKK